MSEEVKRRVCSNCEKPGHNMRTCPEPPKMQTSVVVTTESAVIQIQTAEAPLSASALVPEDLVLDAPTPPASAPTLSLPPPATPVYPKSTEFEELAKQITVNKTLLRLSFRESEGTVNDFVLQFCEDGLESRLQFDTEVATKLFELLGWALQKQAARLSSKILPPKLHTNGAARHP